MLSRVGTSPLPSPALPANSVGTIFAATATARSNCLVEKNLVWPRGGARAP